MDLPTIVSAGEWRTARIDLLAQEKEFTRQRDCPMVEITQEPLGCQEDWEQPSGRSDGPFMHRPHRHDQYQESSTRSVAARERRVRRR